MNSRALRIHVRVNYRRYRNGVVTRQPAALSAKPVDIADKSGKYEIRGGNAMGSTAAARREVKLCKSFNEIISKSQEYIVLSRDMYFDPTWLEAPMRETGMKLRSQCGLCESGIKSAASYEISMRHAAWGNFGE
jgi:hypothetical protein